MKLWPKPAKFTSSSVPLSNLFHSFRLFHASAHLYTFLMLYDLKFASNWAPLVSSCPSSSSTRHSLILPLQSSVLGCAGTFCNRRMALILSLTICSSFWNWMTSGVNWWCETTREFMGQSGRGVPIILKNMQVTHDIFLERVVSVPCPQSWVSAYGTHQHMYGTWWKPYPLLTSCQGSALPVLLPSVGGHRLPKYPCLVSTVDLGVSKAKFL